MTRTAAAPLAVTRLEDRLTPTTPVPSTPLTASGAGVGGPPLVQLYRPDGTIRAQFMAYDAGFTGGVNVAMADVNADGVMDLITAAGAGGGPHVKVYDGKSLENLFDPTQPHAAVVVELTVLHSFYAYDSRFSGGVSVAAGDVDADGYADVITGAGPGGGPHVKAFSGKTGQELRSFFAFDPAFRGGVNVAVGELQEGRTDDREHADVLVGSGAGMKATVTAFNGQTGEQFFSINPYGTFGGGVYVAAGDLTGDGFDDVITGAGAGGGPHVTAYDGFTLGHLATVLLGPDGLQPIRSFMAFDPRFTGGVRVGAGDLNNDTRVDIVAAAGPGGGPHLKGFSGTDAKEMFSTFKYDQTPDRPGFGGGSSIAAAYNPVRPTQPLPAPDASISRLSDFARGTENWAVGFSDYSTAGLPNNHAIGHSGLAQLPAEVGTGTGYEVSGNNLSSDLFMYLKRKYGSGDGLQPNTTYTVDFEVTFASDAPAGLAGAGGAPAESVYLKAGGGATEPTAVTTGTRVDLNVDKGNQANGGPYATVIGNIANGRAATDPRRYASVTRTGRHTVTTDAAGNVWLMVGTDSGHTGTTRLYYQSVEVTFTPAA
jgi:hypothetical protein